LDLTAAEIDWAEVQELVDASYRIVATRKLIRQLDDADQPAMVRSEMP
jgi:hypothetical protein